MSFGDRLAQTRKALDMSQEALAKAIEATPTTIGRYERNEVKPSVETASKIAETLQVSLDYLVGKSDSANILKDKNMVERLNKILNLGAKDREHIIITIDALLRDAQARRAYS